MNTENLKYNNKGGIARVLLAIQEFPEGITRQDLSAKLGMSTSIISRYSVWLESAGATTTKRHVVKTGSSALYVPVPGYDNTRLLQDIGPALDAFNERQGQHKKKGTQKPRARVSQAVERAAVLLPDSGPRTTFANGVDPWAKYRKEVH